MHALLFTLGILGYALACSAQTPTGFFSASVEGGAGYFANYDYDNEEDDLRIWGLYTHSDKRPIGYSFQLGLSRHSKREKLVYGVSFYRWQATGRYNREYFRPDGSLIAFLEEVSVSEAGNVFLARIEPRLLRRKAWALSAYGAAGFSYLQDEGISVPEDGFRPVSIRTRRNSNSNYLELHSQVGATAAFDVNPYYQLLTRFRFNYEISTSFATLIELSAGLQLTFGAGARNRIESNLE